MASGSGGKSGGRPTKVKGNSKAKKRGSTRKKKDYGYDELYPDIPF